MPLLKLFFLDFVVIVGGDGIAMCKVTVVVNHTALVIERVKNIYKDVLHLNVFNQTVEYRSLLRY